MKLGCTGGNNNKFSKFLATQEVARSRLGPCEIFFLLESYFKHAKVLRSASYTAGLPISTLCKYSLLIKLAF